MTTTQTGYPVTEEDFEALVVERSQQTPVLVDISADWCAPCRVLTPLLEQAVAEAGGAVLLAIVDADENMRIAGRHKVRGFPTVIAYKSGVEVGRFSGVRSVAEIRSFIGSVTAGA